MSNRDRWESKELPLLDDRHKKKYQALVGSLLYLMHAPRPDIAYTVIRLSQYSASPRSPHWDGLKRVLPSFLWVEGALWTTYLLVISMLRTRILLAADLLVDTYFCGTVLPFLGVPGFSKQ